MIYSNTRRWSVLLLTWLLCWSLACQPTTGPGEHGQDSGPPDQHSDRGSADRSTDQSPTPPDARSTEARADGQAGDGGAGDRAPADATSPETPPTERSPSSHKATLEEVGKANDPSFIEITDVLLRGSLAYACTGVQGLVIYDVSNPKALNVLAKIGSSRGSSQYPRCQNVWVEGQHAVIANRGDEIQPNGFVALFDVSNPRKPGEVAYYEDGADTSFEGLIIQGEDVFVAAHDKGLYVLKRSPRALTKRARLSGFSNAWGVALLDPQHLLVADGPGGLKVVDITESSKPKIVATLALQGYARRVVTKGHMAYVALGSDGFAIIDLSDPRKPKQRAQAGTTHSLLDLEVIGETVVATNWSDIRTYKVSDPDKPVLIGALVLKRRSGGDGFTRNLAIGAKDGLAFVGEWEGLRSVRFRDGQVPIFHTASHSASFGTIAAGQKAAVAIRIDNLGQAPLQITKIEAQGGLFTVLPASLSIPPGKADIVEITVRATDTKRISGTLVMRTNDPSKALTTLPLIANEGKGGVGDLHQDFTYPDLSGMEHTLYKLRGKVVMLVYFATF